MLKSLNYQFQAVSDLNRGWVLGSKEQHKQLKALQDKNSKREVVQTNLQLFIIDFLVIHQDSLFVY